MAPVGVDVLDGVTYHWCRGASGSLPASQAGVRQSLRRRNTIALGDKSAWENHKDLLASTETALSLIRAQKTWDCSRPRASTALSDSLTTASTCCPNDTSDDDTMEEEPVALAGPSVTSLALLTVFFGCICQTPYEVMHTRDKGCAHLISLFEHLFGIVASLGALRRERQLSWSLHFGLAGANACYTLFINAALSTALPTVVLITMKNGNLAASMLLGACLGHRYSRRQLAAIGIVSCGLVLSSLAGSRCDKNVEAGWSSLLGIIFMAGALLSRAASAALQEHGCRGGQGVSVSELLLYRSALGLPAILCQWKQLEHHTGRWNSSQVSGLAWPTMWLLLLANISFDYAMKVCISSLIERTSALTATLVLTAQRFVAFIISAAFLTAEPLGLDLCIGAVAVLAGTLLYTVPQANPAQKPKDD